MVDNLTRQKLAIEIYLYGYLYCVVMRKLSIKWEWWLNYGVINNKPEPNKNNFPRNELKNWTKLPMKTLKLI